MPAVTISAGSAGRGFNHNVVGFIGPAHAMRARAPALGPILTGLANGLRHIEPSTIVAASVRRGELYLTFPAGRPLALAGTE